MRQAGRNLLISFRDGINAQLDAFIKAETAKSYSPDILKTLIPETVKLWASKSEAESVAVLLPEKDLKVLETSVRSALKDRFAGGIEIKPDSGLTAGFRIGTKDGSAYYDFSAEAVAELLPPILIRALRRSLKKRQPRYGKGMHSVEPILSCFPASVLFGACIFVFARNGRLFYRSVFTLFGRSFSEYFAEPVA